MRPAARTLASLAMLSVAFAPSWRSWFGADKVKHFFMSAFVQSAAYSASRGLGVSRASSHIAAGAASGAVGVWKEVRDRRTGGSFSVGDLAWDAAGAASAAVLLHRAR